MGTNIKFGEVKERKLEFVTDVNYYIKVRINNPQYNGEFGFDWIDIDASGQVKKIQDVPFSEVEYFYKEPPSSSTDLGEIIPISADVSLANETIKKHYTRSLPLCKEVDIPWVLIKPHPKIELSQEIELSLEVNVCSGTLADETIYIEGDEFYKFEIVGGTLNDKRTEKKITAHEEKLVLKVKSLKESGEISYKILQKNSTIQNFQVGGFTMMENKVLKLKFRVIALVSRDNDPNSKAKVLFKKFKDAGVKDYLNKNSLNQAGYEVEIENFDAMDAANVDDYFYDFDKTDWGSPSKNLFTANHTKQEKRVTISWDASGNPIKTETTVNKTVDVIAYEGDIDGITAEEYRKKLASKSISYSGGLIILADFEAKPDHVGAFSQTFPMDHNMLFVYSSNKYGQTYAQTYAHEIGHMLGLAHTFITINASTSTDDIKDYRDKKGEINDYVEKNIAPCKEALQKENKENQISEKNKAPKPLKDQTKTFTAFAKYYIKKITLISCLEHTNIYIRERKKYRSEQITYYTNKINDKTKYSSYSIEEKVVPKSEYKKHLQSELNDNTKSKNELDNRLRANKAVIEKLKIINKNKIFEFTPDEKYYVIYEDKIRIFEDYYQYLLQQWQQMVSNYIYFIKNKTKNIMDYTPSEYDAKARKDIEQRIRFLNHQILIMRKDYENNL